MEKPSDSNLSDYVGHRVRLARTVEHYPVGIFEPGLEGRVTRADESGDTMIHVLLDDHRGELDEWGNELQVTEDPETGLHVRDQVEVIADETRT